MRVILLRQSAEAVRQYCSTGTLIPRGNKAYSTLHKYAVRDGHFGILVRSEFFSSLKELAAQTRRLQKEVNAEKKLNRRKHELLADYKIARIGLRHRRCYLTHAAYTIHSLITLRDNALRRMVKEYDLSGSRSAFVPAKVYYIRYCVKQAYFYLPSDIMLSDKVQEQLRSEESFSSVVSFNRAREVLRAYVEDNHVTGETNG
jgi:hypothetical protein